MPLNGLYKEVILDHYRTPRNRGTLEDATITEGGHNPSCGDTLELFLNISEDGKVSEVRFDGHGCSISMASSSMMTELIKGKPLDEVLDIIKVFEGMMRGEATFPDADEYLDVVSLQGVADFPVRLKCATLAWDTAKRGIEHYRANQK